MTIHFSRRCVTVSNNPNLFHVAIQQLESNAPHCRRVFMVTTLKKGNYVVDLETFAL